MNFRLLDFKQLLDFNYSAAADPELGANSRITEHLFLRWVVEAGEGQSRMRFDVADTMRTTLCRESFEVFQRVCDPRPIAYRDFYYSKLYQYCALLIHESVGILEGDGLFPPARTATPLVEAMGKPIRALGGSVEPDDLEAAFGPDDLDDQPWLEVVNLCLDAKPSERQNQLTAYLRDRAEQRSALPSRVQVRDRLIAELKRAGASRRDICVALDREGIPVTDQMKAAGHRMWQDADGDKHFRRNIQTLFSKAKEKAVKP